MLKSLTSVIALTCFTAAPAIADQWEFVDSEYLDTDNMEAIMDTSAVAFSPDKSFKISVSCQEGMPYILVERVDHNYGYRDEPAMLSIATDEGMQTFNMAGVYAGVFVWGNDSQTQAALDMMRRTSGSIDVLAATQTDIEIRAEFPSRGSSAAIGQALQGCS